MPPARYSLPLMFFFLCSFTQHASSSIVISSESMPVSGKTTSTEDDFSRWIALGLAAVLITIFLFLLNKHNSKLRKTVRFETNTKCSNRIEKIDKRIEWIEGGWVFLLRLYSWSEIETVTNRFADVIGKGAYGIVYRGYLENGRTVAVKKFTGNSEQQARKKVDVEISTIGQAKHKNIVQVIGFCLEASKSSIVYEYVDNGNLEKWLHGHTGHTSPLTWNIRIKIAIGIAKALAYLHQRIRPNVVHLNIKSKNILLDKNWNPKVSGFGSAKRRRFDRYWNPKVAEFGSADNIDTHIMVTSGYMPPEYTKAGITNENTDVYSYGVLLMEIITGRHPYDSSRPRKEVYLVDWFKDMLKSGRGKGLLDSKISVRPSKGALTRALLVCLECVEKDASKRPNMEVLIDSMLPFLIDPRRTWPKWSLCPCC